MRAVESWDQVSIGGLVNLINGFAFPSKGFTEGEGIPLIRIRDLERQKTEVNFRGKYNDRYLVKRDDLLIGMDGDFLTVKWKGNDALLNQRLCKLITKNPESLVQDFLFYRIIEEILRIHRITAATTVKHLSSKDVLGIEIDLPPKHEQTKIAEILSTVDRAIEQTEVLIAKQQRIKTGLMHDLLTRGIDKHGNLRSEQTHRFKDSPLGRIPVEWEVEKWSHVCSKIQDGTHFSPRTDSSAEFKYVTSKNIKFGFLDLSDVEYIDKRQHDEIYKRCDVCHGDVLLTKDGANTGNSAINFLKEEFSLLSSVALIRPLENKLTSMFLLQTILSENGQQLIKDAMSGLAIARVTLEISTTF